MTLSEKETTLFAKQEVTPGVDALQPIYDAASGTQEDKVNAVKPFAISVIDLNYENDNELEDEDELGNSSQSSSTKAVGIETASMTFSQRMRAGNGDPTRLPDWVDNLLASSWKKDSTNGLKITNAVMAPDATTGNTSFAHLYLGERLCASFDIDNAAGSWGDTEGGSGGPTADPVAGEVVVIYPVGGSPDSPLATGRMVEDHASGQTILVRLDRDVTALPANGMNIRVTLGGGGFAYSTLTEDMPLAIVTGFTNAAGVAEIYVYQESGSALTGRKMVGQASTSIVNSFDAPVQLGTVLLPESRTSVDITVGSWSAGAPGVGKIVQRIDHISNTIAAGKILAVNGNTITVKPFRLFGNFENGGNLVTLTDLSGVTVGTQSGDAVAVGSPNRTFWPVVSGFRKRLLGSKGNAAIVLEAGSPGRVNFSFEGGPGAKEDEIPIPRNVSLPNYPAPRWEGGVAEINGKRYTINEMGFDLGAELQRTESANADGGVEGASTDARSATMTATVRRLGAMDPWEDFRRTARRCVAGAIVGKTEGNRYSIVAPNLQVESHSDSADGGRINASLTFLTHGVGGDDEILIHLR